MKISIITPCWNAEKYLRETLLSVQNQTWTEWEHLLVDDGSSDSTPSILEEAARSDSRIKVVSQLNQGVAGARNTGLAASDPKCPFVILLDNDDVWQPNTLETLAHTLQAHPEWTAVHGLARYSGSAPTLFQPQDIESWGRERQGIRNGKLEPWQTEEPTTFAVLAYRCCISTPGQVLIRRASLERAGDFDPNTVPSDDWDMWLRLTRQGAIGFVNAAVIEWRQHAGNESHKTDKMESAMMYVRGKIIRAPENTPEQSRLARTGLKLDMKQRAKEKIALVRWSLQQRQYVLAARQSVYIIKPLLRYTLAKLGTFADTFLFRRS